MGTCVSKPHSDHQPVAVPARDSYCSVPAVAAAPCPKGKEEAQHGHAPNDLTKSSSEDGEACRPFAEDGSSTDLVVLTRAAFPHNQRLGAPHAHNELQRMDTIRALAHMDVDSCAELNTLLSAVCAVWDAPVSSVTLLNSDQVWMCNAQGCGTGHKPWAVAMCPWTLLTPNPMALAVGDLGADARFTGNVHHQGGTQSYLTAPLVASNGHRLGAICFVDGKTRTFDAGDCRLMANFAELAVRELEKHVHLAQRLKEHDSELAKVYSRRVRDIEEVADTCVMLVDTSVPGWQLVYASGGWEEWTGVRRELCVGKTLNQLLEHVHGDPSDDVVWQGLVQSAEQCKSFVMPKVRVRPAFSGNSYQSMFSCFYVSFRPAALDNLDEETVAIGVPSQFPMTTKPRAAKYYFAKLHFTPAPPVNSRVTNVVASTCPSVGILSQRPSAAYDRVSLMSPASALLNSAAARLELLEPTQAALKLFKGLKVGHILGQGNFGTVWHGTWHSTTVALKVVDSDLYDQEEFDRVIAEQALGAQLAHINVVRTLAHASSYLDGKPHVDGRYSVTATSGVRDSGSEDWDKMGSGAGGAGPMDWTGIHMLGGFCVVPCVGGENYLDGVEGQDSAEDAQPRVAFKEVFGSVLGPVLRSVSVEEIDVVPQELDDHPVLSSVQTHSNGGLRKQVTSGSDISPQRQHTDLQQQSTRELGSQNSSAFAFPTLAAASGNGGANAPATSPGPVVVAGPCAEAVESDSGAAQLPHTVGSPAWPQQTPVPDHLQNMAAALAASASQDHSGGQAAVTYVAPHWHAFSLPEGITDLLVSSGANAGARKSSRRGAGQWQVGSGPHAAALQAAGDALAKAVQASMESVRLQRDSKSGDNVLADFGLRRYSSGGLIHKWQSEEHISVSVGAAQPLFPLRLRQWTLLEFADWGSLADACDRGVLRVRCDPRAPADLALITAAATDIALGLRYLHSKKIVHGDLTAFNVLLASTAAPNEVLPEDTRGWVGKLSDFGLSKQMPQAHEEVKSATYGAITHMAPEVLSDNKVGYKGDVYSAGVIMWQMFTGSRPWAGLSHIQVSVAVAVDHLQLQWPEPIGDSGPQQDPCVQQYQQLAARCMAADPNERPSAEQLVDLLKTLFAQVVSR